MSWINTLLPPSIQNIDHTDKKIIPEGLWIKCPHCEAVLYSYDLENNLRVCPKCRYHMRISARDRLDKFLDLDNRFEIGKEILPIDILKFQDTKRYKDRLKNAKESTGETDALIVMSGSICSIPVIVSCFEFKFLGGSMGSVVGERFVRGVLAAIEKKKPFICIIATGGARMQESLLSLMQMAKTNAILVKLSQARLPYISILTNPTMGGVSASFAFMGDIIIAEPMALIGFAGPRVIEQTVREKLPDGFQRSEFLLKKGAIDMIIDRRNIRHKVANILSILLKK